MYYGLKSQSTEKFSLHHPIIPDLLWSQRFTLFTLPANLFPLLYLSVAALPEAIQLKLMDSLYEEVKQNICSPYHLWSISFPSPCLCIILSAGDFTQPNALLLKQIHSWFRGCISTASVTLLWCRSVSILTHWTQQLSLLSNIWFLECAE